MWRAVFLLESGAVRPDGEGGGGLFVRAVVSAVAVMVMVPLLPALVSFAHWRLLLRKRVASLPKHEEPPASLWQRWRPYWSYAFSDARDAVLWRSGREREDDEGNPVGPAELRIPVQFRWLWLLCFMALGAVGAVAGALWLWRLLLVVIVLCPALFALMVRYSREPVDGRERILMRMFEFTSKRLGYDKRKFKTHHDAVRVEEWRDITMPKVVAFQVPLDYSYDIMDEESFVKGFNSAFGHETAWIPREGVDPKTKRPRGWDPDAGTVTLESIPPLPTRAPFMEHYVMDPHVPWSFFPMGLGVRDGLILENPETGEDEHVIGYDIFGTGLAMADAGEITMSPNQGKASPMAVIAGVTGSGKALPVDTPVLVLESGD